jgi:hypothetical protein
MPTAIPWRPQKCGSRWPRRTRAGTVNARSLNNDALPGDHGWGTSIRPDGTFRLKLPPGEYALEAQANRLGLPRAGEEFGRARLSVGAQALEGITIVIGGGAQASGRVMFEGRTPPPVRPEPIRLPIHWQDSVTCRAGQATIARNWTHVPPPDVEMAAVMTNRRVATSSSPQASLAPPDVSRQVMSGLPTGNYYAVALDDIEIDALLDPDVLERLIASATRVAVSYDAPASVALRRIKLSDVVR